MSRILGRRSARVLALLTCVASVGCAGVYSAPVAPPPGLLFARYSAPLDIDTDQVKASKKIGRASTESILGLVARGDASIATAAKAGQITTIRHVDYEFENLLGLYSKFTVVVYGD